MRIAIVGASGAVGQELMKVLEQHGFGREELLLFGSERSAGRKYRFAGRDITVSELGATPDQFRDVDITFASAGAGISRRFRQDITRFGSVLIDNSSAFRMEEDVPLVVPQVNPEDALRAPHGVIANPNCTTIQLVITLQALEQLSHVTRVRVATYQAASGAGMQAMDELEQQYRDVLAGREAHPERFQHQLAYNVIPHIGDFDADNGYTAEELKMYNETRKIMHSDIAVSAMCVRVPSLRAHSEAIWAETERSISPDEAREAFLAFHGITVLDVPGDNIYPMPLDLSGRDDVFVGRIRSDLSHPRGLTFWSVSDQIRRGAALNAVEIAEYIIRNR